MAGRSWIERNASENRRKEIAGLTMRWNVRSLRLCYAATQRGWRSFSEWCSFETDHLCSLAS